MNEKLQERLDRVGFATVASEVNSSDSVAGPRPVVLPEPTRVGLENLRKNWRIIVITIAATLLVAWLITAIQPKRYEAEVLAAVAPAVEGLAAEEVLRGVDTLERRTLVSTIAALASASGTRTLAMQPGPPSDGYLIEAIVLPNTNLVQIHVSGDDRNRVASIANRVPALLSAQARAMYGLYRVTTISAATAPEQASSPRVGRTLVAGLILGTILGTLLALVLGQRQLPAAR